MELWAALRPERGVSPFFLAAALAALGQLEEARTAARAGLSLDPTFTVSRLRAGASSDNPTYLGQRERIYDGMRRQECRRDEGPGRYPPTAHGFTRAFNVGLKSWALRVTSVSP